MGDPRTAGLRVLIGTSGGAIYCAVVEKRPGARRSADQVLASDWTVAPDFTAWRSSPDSLVRAVSDAVVAWLLTNEPLPGEPEF